MSPLCVVIVTGMLFCGGNDFRPVNDTTNHSSGFWKAQVQVDGYYRSDGTYVQPYTRGYPDGQCWNNKAGCR